jgi:isoamylase
VLSNLFETLPHALLEGYPTPMGAIARNGGVNFAVFSDHATGMELCVFDADGQYEMRRWRMHGPHDGVWHAFLPGVGARLVYGFRAHGPWAPEQGHRFNPRKLLLDPCAREIVGRFEWRVEHLERGPEGGPDRRDNAAFALKARVAEPVGVAPGWRNAPRHAERDLVIYEVQVKSFSMLHPGIPDELRGTYAALAHPAAIGHFKRLGVTALELLPVQYHVDEAFLGPKGLSNHWGYNTLGFFCADSRRTAATPPRPTTSSARWWPRCMRTASRCCWTWSTTTRPKPTNAARPSPSVAWTTPRGTGWTNRAAA